MNVLVIGAAGKLGSEVVKRALSAGHKVTAFVHHAAEAHLRSGVRVIEGDSTDAAAIDNAVQDQNAVLDTLGGKTPYKETTLESTTAVNLVRSMERHGFKRLVVTSMLGEGDSKANTGFFYEHILMSTFLHGSTPDKALMETKVSGSNLDWSILRPAILTDGEATGHIRVFTPETGGTAHKISRADVAQFMVDQLTSDTYLRQAVTIATS